MLTGTPATAQPQQGVALDVGRIDVDEDLAPGGRYQLPTIRVRNPGTALTNYRMAIQSVAGSGAPDAAWLRISPAGFSLAPDERQPLEVSLELPADVPAGEYAALVTVQVVPDRDGARVGAAAATRLTFRVPGTPQQVSAPSGNASSPTPVEDPAYPWLLVVVAVLGLLLSAWAARRYDIHIERRP